MPSVIVWDLETVPDLNGYAAANGLLGQSDENIREHLGDKFPKHIYHSIVCIGAVVAHFENDSWIVDAIGAPHVGERTEKELISAFVDKIAELLPQVVTFNGTSFDLPVLRYRAMIHGISAPGLACRPYFKRYTSDALDLCDELSSFSSNAKVKLDELSKVLGFPGKPSDIDGSDVEKYFNEGRIQEIAAYCETDVVNTYRVWLRYELFCGRLTASSYETSEKSLNEYLRSHVATKPHLLFMLDSKGSREKPFKEQVTETELARTVVVPESPQVAGLG
jgi:predicted PolB exonuclease-like 3'-5' exonuclease